MQRLAVVYRIVNGPDEGRWRIRLEIAPEPYGWAGGQVLWGFDQDTEAAADAIAERWVKDGFDPRYSKVEIYGLPGSDVKRYAGELYE